LAGGGADPAFKSTFQLNTVELASAAFFSLSIPLHGTGERAILVLKKDARWRLLLSFKALVRRKLNRVLQPTGFKIERVGTGAAPAWRTTFPDVEPWVEDIIETVRPFTMTTGERISALCHAVRYVAKNKIPGDIVECGVWRGGSMMAAAMTLLSEHDLSRTLHLFDTFGGMTSPTVIDRRVEDRASASELLEKASKTSPLWANAPLDDVRANLASTSYPANRLRFIRGKVEDTLPGEAPDAIAILRLDTDWYESTKHELTHLYPKLSVGGALIIDDYGAWEGARKAVDEYINDNRLPVLLQRIDFTGRIIVKIGSI
jgi:O-methyltransferase